MLGHAHFNIAAGHSKRVPVHIASAGRRLFGTHASVNVQATVTTHDSHGHPQQTTTRVTVTRARA